MADQIPSIHEGNIDKPIVWHVGWGGENKSRCTFNIFHDVMLAYDSIKIMKVLMNIGWFCGKIVESVTLTLLGGGFFVILWSIPPSHTTTTPPSKLSTHIVAFDMNWGGDHDILEIKFVFDASFACSHKSKGSPLSHHINMMWKHVCDGSRLRSNRSACNSTKYMDPWRRSEIGRV